MKAQKSVNTITLRRTDGLEVALRVQSETAEYWYGRPTYNAISSNYLKTEWSIVEPAPTPTPTPDFLLAARNAFGDVSPAWIDACRQLSEGELETAKNEATDLDCLTILNKLIFIARYEKEIAKLNAEIAKAAKAQ